MGYMEKIMGDTERVVYRTHKHVTVLLQRAFWPLLAFALLLALGVAAFLAPDNNIRFIITVAGFCSLVAPLYLVVRAWMEDERGRDLARRIWMPVATAIAVLTLSVILLSQKEWVIVGWIGIALALIPLGRFIRRLLEWVNERYVITNRRVMEVRGIINKHVRDSALEKVNDVDLNQSFAGRILRYGTVQIITGSDIGLNMFRRISNPVKFKRAMLNAKEELQTQAPAYRDLPELDDVDLPVGDEAESARLSPPASLAPDPATHEPTPGARSGSGIPELIAELDELRRRGILTEDEFRAKKQELLSRL